MTRRHAADPRRRGTAPRPAADQAPAARRAASARDSSGPPAPSRAPLLAIDAQPKPFSLPAATWLAHSCRARHPRTAATSARCRRVAGRPRKCQLGAHRLGLKPRHEPGEVVGMGADVTGAAGRLPSVPGRCATPPASGPCLEPLVSQSCAYSACTTRIGPSSPAAIMLARLPHHRIAGVVVRQHEHLPRFRTIRRALARRPASWSAACRRSRGCRRRGTPWPTESACGSA